MNILKKIGAFLIDLGVRLGGVKPEVHVAPRISPETYAQLEKLAPIGSSGDLNPHNAAFMCGQQHILKHIRNSFMV